MGCPCQQRGSTRFVAQPQAKTTPQTNRQNLAYEPPPAPIRRSGSLFWDGAQTRRR